MISGDSNNNVLDGQGGNDVLDGPSGKRECQIGGGGSYQFFYSAGTDTITDFDQSAGSFNHAEGDVIDLVGSGVTKLHAAPIDHEPEWRRHAD